MTNGTDTSTPLGVTMLKSLLVAGTLAVYAALWVWFFVVIWQAGGGAAPHLSAKALYVSSVVGGVLATFFAASLGVQRQDSAIDARKLDLGRTLIGPAPASPSAKPLWNISTMIATAAVWLYALIGVFALLTVLVHSVQSPPSVTAMASAFASIVLALVAGALAPGQRLQR